MKLLFNENELKSKANSHIEVNANVVKGISSDFFKLKGLKVSFQLVA